ncbi:MAG: hypothetical protein WEE89_07205 [Gemmatimonadota bacterium]
MQPNNIVELSIPQPDSAMAAQAQALLTNAESFTVASAPQYSDAGELLKLIKGKSKELDETRKSMTKPLDDSKKRVMEFFAKPLDFLARAESTVKRAMIAYSEEQDRLRREEQRKADEIARKERERIEAQARKAAESGKQEKAEQLQERAATVVAPVIQREAPRVVGQNMREVWKFEITNEDMVPRSYCVPDEKKIRAIVQAMKSGTAIPGVRVYAEKSLASSAA